VAVSDADRALFVIQEIEVGAGGPTLALSRDGNLFGWGWSFQGSLGLEGAINAWAYASPVLVMAAP
jgi:alpha-tubulin suppressor-like RCC1 family protein